MAESRSAGVFNANGPDYTLTMGHFLEECRAASGSDARLTWVGEKFLTEMGVGAWGELPLWIPEADETHRHFLRVNCSRANAAGLRFRPLAETIRDTLAWQADGAPAASKDGVPVPDATLKPERERELLDAWHNQ